MRYAVEGSPNVHTTIYRAGWRPAKKQAETPAPTPHVQSSAAAVTTSTISPEQAEQERRQRFSLIGTTLTKFKILDGLGHGCFGNVYKAEDTGLRDFVAIKELRLEDPESLREEARVLSRLRHEHIVGFRELFAHASAWYMVMDYVDGPSLEHMIRTRSLYEGGPKKAFWRMIKLAKQFAAGLSKAHTEGVIHQDVKPGNVLVANPGSSRISAKVSDFGLSRARPIISNQDTAYQYAQPGKGIMCVRYCSPEQQRGDDLTTKTDAWSWGLSCLEMFRGDAPWEIGVTAAKALDDFLKVGPIDTSIPRPMPTELVNLLRACFSPAPANRPGMEDIFDELTRLQGSEKGKQADR